MSVLQVALSAPLSIASLVSDQARSYPNMIDPLMDAVKFFSPLAFDVLTFVLVDELARNTGKIKDDGISTADWLTNLAVFTGMLCKKYPFSMEVHAILQYVANQLKCWQSMDLLVLEKVITSMTVRLAMDVGVADDGCYITVLYICPWTNVKGITLACSALSIRDTDTVVVHRPALIHHLHASASSSSSS